MWMMTKFGFFSIVRADPPGVKFMIRARIKDHLMRLKKACPELKPFPITESRDNDYKYRIIVPSGQMAIVMGRLWMAVTYRNFKDEVYKEFGNDEYEMALHDVWTRMVRLQK